MFQQLWREFLPYISLAFPAALYLKISGKKLTIKEIIFLVLGELATLFIYQFISNPYTDILIFPLYYVGVALIFGHFNTFQLSIFYGLFPIVAPDLFRRFLIFFISPLFSLSIDGINQDDILKDVVDFISYLLVWLFLRVLDYDFSKLNQHLTAHMRKFIYLTNMTMIVYYVLLQWLAYAEVVLAQHTQSYRILCVAIYTILFLLFLMILDRDIRDDLQRQLIEQKEREQESLGAYIREVEGLYRSIRSFRHDYINIITSLKLGIDKKDIDQIRETYDEVVRDSAKPILGEEYAIARLVNIKDQGIKGILYAKVLEARAKGIKVTVECPDVIENSPISATDFITIISILADNAIEATLSAEIPQMTLSLVKDGQHLVLIIGNSMLDKRVNTSDIFNYGISSKGDNRGIGLTKLMGILNSYPQVQLRTKSENFQFIQKIIF